MTTLTDRTFHDAGLLRGFLVERYHAQILGGGSLGVMDHLHRCMKLLARMSGLPLDQVVADLRQDAEIYEASIE